MSYETSFQGHYPHTENRAGILVHNSSSAYFQLAELAFEMKPLCFSGVNWVPGTTVISFRKDRFYFQHIPVSSGRIIATSVFLPLYSQTPKWKSSQPITQLYTGIALLKRQYEPPPPTHQCITCVIEFRSVIFRPQIVLRHFPIYTTQKHTQRHTWYLLYHRGCLSLCAVTTYVSIVN